MHALRTRLCVSATGQHGIGGIGVRRTRTREPELQPIAAWHGEHAPSPRCHRGCMPAHSASLEPRPRLRPDPRRHAHRGTFRHTAILIRGHCELLRRLCARCSGTCRPHRFALSLLFSDAFASSHRSTKSPKSHAGAGIEGCRRGLPFRALWRMRRIASPRDSQSQLILATTTRAMRLPHRRLRSRVAGN